MPIFSLRVNCQILSGQLGWFIKIKSGFMNSFIGHDFKNYLLNFSISLILLLSRCERIYVCFIQWNLQEYRLWQMKTGDLSSSLDMLLWQNERSSHDLALVTCIRLCLAISGSHRDINKINFRLWCLPTPPCFRSQIVSLPSKLYFFFFYFYVLAFVILTYRTHVQNSSAINIYGAKKLVLGWFDTSKR